MMKKISLKNLAAKDVQLLSKEELKSIMGGVDIIIPEVKCAERCTGWDSVTKATKSGTCTKTVLSGYAQSCVCTAPNSLTNCYV